MYWLPSCGGTCHVPHNDCQRCEDCWIEHPNTERRTSRLAHRRSILNIAACMIRNCLFHCIPSGHHLTGVLPAPTLAWPPRWVHDESVNSDVSPFIHSVRILVRWKAIRLGCRTVSSQTEKSFEGSPCRRAWSARMPVRRSAFGFATTLW